MRKKIGNKIQMRQTIVDTSTGEMREKVYTFPNIYQEDNFVLMYNSTFYRICNLDALKSLLDDCFDLGLLFMLSSNLNRENLLVIDDKPLTNKDVTDMYHIGKNVVTRFFKKAIKYRSY